VRQPTGSGWEENGSRRTRPATAWSWRSTGSSCPTNGETRQRGKPGAEPPDQSAHTLAAM